LYWFRRLVSRAHREPFRSGDGRSARDIEPAEVAAAAAFLLGPDGRAVTGAPLVLDLGWTSR